MICARKINDEINVFDGITNNSMFIGVWFTIIGGQIIMVFFGGWAMKVHIDGLSFIQWVITVGVSLFSFLINICLKFVPDHIWPTMGDEDEVDVADAKKDYANLLKFRKSKDLSSSIRQGNFI